MKQQHELSLVTELSDAVFFRFFLPIDNDDDPSSLLLLLLSVLAVELL